jgi:hypothetical protein
MSTEDDITYDRSMLGVEHLIGSFPITREMILEFAASTAETHPLYSDEAQAKASEYGGLIAPPTFCNIFVDGLRRPDIKLEFGDVGLFASQAIENVDGARCRVRRVDTVGADDNIAFGASATLYPGIFTALQNRDQPRSSSGT